MQALAAQAGLPGRRQVSPPHFSMGRQADQARVAVEQQRCFVSLQPQALRLGLVPRPRCGLLLSFASTGPRPLQAGRIPPQARRAGRAGWVVAAAAAMVVVLVASWVVAVVAVVVLVAPVALVAY